MTVRMPAQIREAIVAHSVFVAPEEACGLLAADAGGRLRMAYCLTNRDRSPRRFTVDPSEHFQALRHAERNSWELVGAFHSHPNSAAYPSPTDIAGALDPSWLYVIVGLRESRRPEVRAFRITDGRVVEERIAAQEMAGR